MKKIIIIALVLGLVAGALAAPAAAGKKKKKKKNAKVERTVEGSYMLPSLVIAGGCAQQDAIGCVRFAVGAGEKFVTAVKITDDNGLPIYASIQQDTDGDAQADNTVGAFCGELEGDALEFVPGANVDVWILTPPRDPTCPGQGTSGQVEITFSNKP